MKKFIFLLAAFGLFFFSCNKEEIAEKTNPSTTDQVDSKAPTTCTCVKYIKNRVVITNTYGVIYAKDYGQVLPYYGYYQVSEPQNKDIVIFNVNYGGNINSTAGHIGMVATATKIGTGSSAYWRLKVVGANQSGTVWTEYNCTNVSFLNTDVNTTVKKNNISYWRKSI